MRKTVLFVILLLAIGFSTITRDDAWNKAYQYLDGTETIGLEPVGLTESGTDSYWVMELKGTLGAISVMLPINSETGEVDVRDSMKDVLKTHYLANYFATQDAVLDLLNSVFSFAQSRDTELTNAMLKLEVSEAQLPSNITLVNLQLLEDAIDDANLKNKDLRDKIQETKVLISQSKWRTTDVDVSNTALNSVFTKEESFLEALDNVALYANALYVEMAGNSDLKTQNYDLVLALQVTIDSYRLTEGAPTAMGDDLTARKSEVTLFFRDLDSVSAEYLTKLRNRVNAYISDAEIQEIRSSLVIYNANYTTINNNAQKISPSVRDGIKELYDTYNEAKTYFDSSNYSQAKALFADMDRLIESLMPHISDCPPSCTGGKEPTGDCTCACPSGTTESNGQCMGGFSLNLPLIGGLILIIIIFIVFKYKDKIFPGGGKVEEKSKDSWTNYKF